MNVTEFALPTLAGSANVTPTPCAIAPAQVRLFRQCETRSPAPSPVRA